MSPKIKLALIGVILLILLSAQFAQAFIKCKGKDFVDENNNKVFFRGYGLGGWLVPEGYMLHTPGFGSPSSIHEQIVDVVGEANAQLFWQEYRKNYVNEKDIQKIAEWGYNSIRLPFNYRLISPQDLPGVYLEEGFAIIDTLMSWCKKHNLYLILDMHCAPGGQNHGNISDSDGTARLWLESAYQDRTVDIWKKIAERYVNEPIIAGYDLLNEPVLPEGHSTTELRSLYMRITSAIRQVDKNHVIFIEGNVWATDFSNMTPIWDVNMAYSFHKYWSEPTKASIQSLLNLRNETNVPLWMGESGENSNPWFYSTIRVYEENNIGWCWWAHKKIETITSPYSAPVSESYQKVLDYWNGTAAKPSQAFALSALLGEAQNLALEKCQFHPDVLKAQLDAQFGSAPKPFVLHEIPGKIPCAEYDFGTNGIAYADSDYQKSRWDVDQPWNRGHLFRNDGVDIEKSKDNSDAIYSIGWIKKGEWMKYTIDISKQGGYDFIFRIASLSGGGSLQLLLDDVVILPSLSVPKTNGWYTWDTVKAANINLPVGLHVLTLKILKDGFNINQIEVQANPNGGMGNNDEMPDEFYLGQNFPNPFNNSTKIPFKTRDDESIEISIVNINGQLIKRFTSSSDAEQLAHFIWDGTNEDHQSVGSGLYYYQLKVGKEQKTRAMVCLR